MRHKMSGWRLGRSSAHRKSLRKNLIGDLLAHGEIVTTEAKARMLRPAAERIITLAKRGLAKGGSSAVHARRLVAARIYADRVIEEGDAYVPVDALRKLFDEIAPRYANRPGGYTRLIKLPRRQGDNAKMALVQLVDNNPTEEEAKEA
jgi:large subunit ribosomal protein L17